MSRRASDAFAAKQRRQKMIAIGGGVMLLGLLAIQGPRMWKQMHPSTPAPAAAPATATVPGSPTVPATPGAATPVAASPTLVAARAPRSASIAGTAIPAQAPLAPAEGQLRTFSTFATKDPFKQQVSSESAAAAAPSASSPAPAAASASPRAATPPAATASTPPVSARPTAGTSAKPANAKAKKTRVAPKALILVNGKGQLVAPKDSFPKSSKVFKLVSLKGNVARIAVVGGSYANGEATVDLRAGKKLTLLNTATGDRYVLKLATAKAGGATGFSLRTPAN
jgi:hypothetical protein